MEIKNTVIEISSFDDCGYMELAELGEYAKAFGVGEDEAEVMLEDALEELVDDGTLTETNDGYYLTEILEENAEEDRRLAEEHEQYLADIDAAWYRVKGWR